LFIGAVIGWYSGQYFLMRKISTAFSQAFTEKADKPLTKPITVTAEDPNKRNTEYAQKYLKVTNVRVDKGLNGKTEFIGKIKNIGDKNVMLTTMTIYYADANGVHCGETSEIAASNLKPNYETDFYIDDYPPECWANHAFDYAITKIDFGAVPK